MLKRRAKRDTYLYQLKRSRKVVHVGITNNPARRESEHRRSGKRFTHMKVYPYPMSREEALRREKKKKK